MNFKFGPSLFCCLFLTSCALPPTGEVGGGFVPKREVKVVALVNEGLDLYRRSRYPEAESFLRQALYLAPQAENLKLNLSQTLVQLGVYDEAEEIYKEILVKNENPVKVILLLAELFYKKGDYLQAIEYYKQAMNLSLDDQALIKFVNSAKSISALYYKIGLEEKAVCYAEFAQIVSNGYSQILSVAKLLIANGEYDLAEKLMSEHNGGIKVVYPDLLLLKSLIHLGRANYLDAYLLLKRLDGARKLPPKIAFDKRSLEQLLEEFDIPESVILSKDDSDDQKEEDLEKDQQEEVAKEILAILELASVIYWPPDYIYHLNKDYEPQLIRIVENLSDS